MKDSKSQATEKCKLEPWGGTVLYPPGWLSQGNRSSHRNTVVAQGTCGLTSRELWDKARAREPCGVATPEYSLVVFPNTDLKITHLPISLEKQKPSGGGGAMNSKNEHLPRLDKALGSTSRSMRKSFFKKQPLPGCLWQFYS